VRRKTLTRASVILARGEGKGEKARDRRRNGRGTLAASHHFILLGRFALYSEVPVAKYERIEVVPK